MRDDELQTWCTSAMRSIYTGGRLRMITRNSISLMPKGFRKRRSWSAPYAGPGSGDAAPDAVLDRLEDRSTVAVRRYHDEVDVGENMGFLLLRMWIETCVATLL